MKINVNELKTLFKLGESVVLVPKHGSDYRSFLREMTDEIYWENNMWNDWDTVHDRVELIKIWSNDGKEAIELKPATFLRVTEPYTMEALEIYGHKSNFKYIILDDGDIELVETSELDKVYDIFFKPLQALENARFEILGD